MTVVKQQITLGHMLQALAMLATVGSTVWYLQGRTDINFIISKAMAEDVSGLTVQQQDLAERTRLLESIVAGNAVRHSTIKKELLSLGEGQKTNKDLLIRLLSRGRD